MPSSGMLGRVALVRTDVSEERITPIIRVTRIGKLGTTLAVTSNRSTCRLLGCYAAMLIGRTDVSEKRIVSTISMTRVGELGTLAVTGNRSTRRLPGCYAVWRADSYHSDNGVIRSSETSFLTRATRRNIPVGGIL
jgi:hypothetical protein